MLRRLAPLVGALALASAPAGGEPPSAGEVIRMIGFPAGTEERVLAGEFVSLSLESVSERDLAVALTFLLRVPTEEFARELVQEQLLTAVDPNTRARGEFAGEGSAADLAGLVLSAAEREAYRSGDGMNLSKQERQALQGLEGSGAEVDALVREQLLARLRAYRARGLGGIVESQRGGGTTESAADLRKATETLTGLSELRPDVFRAILEYPKARAAGLEEVFFWSHYTANKVPTVALTHALLAEDDGLYVGMQRQFHVNRGYNVEQAVAGFFPVKGGTLIAYTNHTFTDQVAGFGGGAKRSIGQKIMASQLSALWERLGKKVAAP